ncbi:MAG: mitochondrial fission ELM1 family protein [Alphaproteobacteria bacterium]|nr:mitochondrial fission ELM1 family protein [Alphaproteobacteria bacterium]
MNIKDIKAWIITEGMIGTQNQCLGVAEALGITPIVKQVSLHQPWKTLTPWLGFEQSFTFTEPLTPPWPDLLIASGRKAVAASRYIKKKSGGKTFTVQIQDPKCSSKNFDLVAVPHHDTLRGANVVVNHGAPNRITSTTLETARSEFEIQFSVLPSPRIAVLIGGNSRTHKLTPDIMLNLVSQLKVLNGHLMITASRRTGDENLKILQDGLRDTNTFIWDGTGKNPYHAMLAWADHILVTADSVSMISDAATTGKPVHIIPLEGHSPRFDRFHAHMQKIGAARPFNGNLQNWSYEPLNDAKMVADAIEQAMQKRYG